MKPKTPDPNPSPTAHFNDPRTYNPTPSKVKPPEAPQPSQEELEGASPSPKKVRHATNPNMRLAAEEREREKEGDKSPDSSEYEDHNLISGFAVQTVYEAESLILSPSNFFNDIKLNNVLLTNICIDLNKMWRYVSLFDQKIKLSLGVCVDNIFQVHLWNYVMREYFNTINIETGSRHATMSSDGQAAGMPNLGFFSFFSRTQMRNTKLRKF